MLALIAGIPSDARGEDHHGDLAASIKELKQLPFEELVGVTVTSVARRPQSLLVVPSAIQVITAEEISRSGASSLPEALRLASNLQVAQVDSHQWAISARGFNSVTANKLLVLIDGRTVYTPLFSGVFWDVQNVMLEDIDHIEVISGPGAAQWGANAVNGVINVISKGADKTQGTLVSAGAGTFLEDFASVRYGGRAGSNVFFRVYGMGFERDSTLLPNGHHGTNDIRLAQGGFRTDWLPSTGDQLTVQGDAYGGNIAQPAPGDIKVNGQNVVTRWIHPLGDESDISFRLYWDRTYRNITTTLAEELNTYDADFAHRLAPLYRNRVTWGMQYRMMMDEVDNSATIAFRPERVNLELFSGFLQDEITLVEDTLFLTLGSKLELNDYSGWEIQPSGRIAWLPTTNQTIWGAVSRAVRSPSRIDTELFVPGEAPFAFRGGGSRFDSERLLAYELGYRAELPHNVGVSLSGFFNEYEDVRSLEPQPDGSAIILNGLRAKTYGVEFAGAWRPIEWWRLRGGYTYLRKHIYFDHSRDISRGTGEGNDPEHQFTIQSMVNLPANVQFDSVLRYVDDLDQRGPFVRAYLSLDLRLAWRPTPNWELAIVGQNLLDRQHPEFGARAARQEIPRSVYGKVTWQF
jgi:iron complex outermembrane recepter protein